MQPAPDPETHTDRFSRFLQTQDAGAYLAACEAALERAPDDVNARLGVAVAAGHAGDYDRRMRLLRELVRDYPNSDKPNVALGLELMSLGRFAEGWRHYAFRKPNRFNPSPDQALPPRLEWTGQPLEGKTILVRREQGLGDTLHFVRYVMDLQRRGARTLIDAQGAIRPLLRGSPALGAVLQENERIAPHFWAHMLDLVPSVTPKLTDVRWQGSYVAPPAGMGPFADLARQAGLRVGVAWAGSGAFGMNAIRSMPLSALAPLAEVPGCRYFSLLPATEDFEKSGAEGWLTDLSAVTYPFERLAAVTAQMDVVVTVCTSIAHLAGAMGKPTLLMLSKIGEWRWGRQGDQTPWYPSMRLFRQRDLGDWTPVVADVCAALRAF